MRRLFLAVMILSFVLVFPVLSRAHSAGISAILDTEPMNLTPGQQAKIAVGLFDVYQSPIAGARLRIRVEQDGRPQQQPISLTELIPGTYTGEITVLGAGLAVLSVEATLPDGLWSGPLPIQTGPDGTKIWDFGVELLHQDSAPTPAPSQTASPAASPPITPAEQRRLFNSPLLPVVASVPVVLLLGAVATRLVKHRKVK